jgi:bifunctional DNA-binding transcriptional regulator/antitoxin component of YhaV-PrlF toxin-antitoxin module
VARVTSKRQVTIPKVIADQYSIRKGTDLEWVAAGDSIRIVTKRRARSELSSAVRLRLFDQASLRQLERKAVVVDSSSPSSRGWSRKDLYRRGHSG